LEQEKLASVFFVNLAQRRGAHLKSEQTPQEPEVARM
jgi:hypothetical protein